MVHVVHRHYCLYIKGFAETMILIESLHSVIIPRYE